MNESSLLLFEWVMTLMAIALILGLVGSSSPNTTDHDLMPSPHRTRSKKSCTAAPPTATSANHHPKSKHQSQDLNSTIDPALNRSADTVSPSAQVSAQVSAQTSTQASALNPQTAPATDAEALYRLQERYQLLKQELAHQEVRLQEEFQAKTFHQLQSLLVSFPTALQATHHQPDLPARNLRPLFSSLESLLETWGYEAIASPWEQVEFDPQIHQPDKDDIAVGEKVYVRFVGYRTGDRILCPAKVSRSLPQLLQQS